LSCYLYSRSIYILDCLARPDISIILEIFDTTVSSDSLDILKNSNIPDIIDNLDSPNINIIIDSTDTTAYFKNQGQNFTEVLFCFVS